MELEQSPRRIRLLELLLVTSIAFAGPVYGSFYYFLGGLKEPAGAGAHVYSLITELLGLSVLVYVLFRQGRQVRDIGFAFNWRDIPRSLAVAVIGYVAFCVCYLAVYYGCFALTGLELTAPELRDKVLGARFHWIALIFVLVNPFFEELIVRAYLMTEVKFLTGSAALSIVASVGTTNPVSPVSRHAAGAVGSRLVPGIRALLQSLAQAHAGSPGAPVLRPAVLVLLRSCQLDLNPP